MLKYLHTDVGFTAEDVRRIHCDCVVYLRTGYGLTRNDARRVIRTHGLSSQQSRMIAEVFELE